MRKRRSLFKRLISALIALVVIAMLASWLLMRGSLPLLTGKIGASGLNAQTSIERDALGVATIHGTSRRDVSFALGYTHAQERFFEMDLMRRDSAGELAELIGAMALPRDRQHRPFRMRARAEQTLAGVTAEQRTDLAAYRDGVNAGLAGLSSRPWEYWLLGSSPRAWTEADSILVLDTMFFDLNDTSNARELAFAQIHAALPESVYKFLSASGGAWDAPLLGPPMATPPLPPESDIDLRRIDPKLLRVAATSSESPQLPGSNSFAVAGALTDTHAAIVANDMHLGLRVPGTWFRARLMYPNPRRAGQTVDLTGVSLPGVPALVAGSNRHVAWAFTNSYGDWMDWVRVNLDPADKSRYRSNAGMQALQQSEEIIKVHNAADDKLVVRDTQWGPILAADADGTPLALAWTALEPGGVNIELMHMDVAETADEAMDTANAAGMPPQNFVVGDRVGNIAWTIAGRIPKRIGNYDPLLPSDWSQPGTGWDGWLAPGDYPRLPNPPAQRLWTANARTMDFESADYAHLGDGGYDLGARAMQIRDDLKAKNNFTTRDMLEIQLDDRTRFLEHWHDLLMATLNHAGDNVTLAQMKPFAADWNASADAASVGYRITHEWRHEVTETVLDGFAAAVRVKYADFKLLRMGMQENMVAAVLGQHPPHLLPPGYASWDDLLLRCAERVAKKLTALPGGYAARTWGEANTARIRHPLSSSLPGLGWLLDMPAQPLDGDANMPRVQGPSFGASERFAVAPGHEDDGYFHMPAGQSDNPLSPFYGAGHQDWVQGKPTPFMPGAAKYTLTLTPN